MQLRLFYNLTCVSLQPSILLVWNLVSVCLENQYFFVVHMLVTKMAWSSTLASVALRDQDKLDNTYLCHIFYFT